MMGWSTFPIRKEAKKLWKADLASFGQCGRKEIE